MRELKKFVVLFLVCMFCIGMLKVPVNAASEVQDGLEVTLNTEKDRYDKGESIAVTLKVTNTGTETITGILLENVVPDGYKPADNSELSRVINALNAGESVELTVVYDPDDTEVSKDDDTGEDSENESETGKENINETDNNAAGNSNGTGNSTGSNNNGTGNSTGSNNNGAGNSEADFAIGTGDSSTHVVWLLLLLVSLGGILFALIEKKGSFKKLMSFLLCIVLAGTSIYFSPVQVSAEENDSSIIRIKEMVQVGDERVELNAFVTYHLPYNLDTEKIVTREEWITALAEVMKLDPVEDTFYSFDDFDKASNPALIEASVRAGFVLAEADRDNMVYLRPNESATREFVAYTAVHALDYQITNDELPDWVDKMSLGFPAEDELAVKLGIISLADNSFLPDRELTSGDMKKALAAIRRVLASEDVDSDSGNGAVTYVDGVYETELFYELDEVNSKIYIMEEAKIAGWRSGEVHVLISADGTQKDIAIKIVKIVEEEGWTVIYYEEPALEEVALSFDLEGVQITGGAITPAEGVTFTDAPVSRAATNGTVPLFGKKKYSFTVDDITVEGSIDMKEIEYRFAASPSWHLITIDEVYLAVNSATEINVSYMRGYEADNDTIPDFAEDEAYDKRVKLANIDCPLPYGFNISGEIYAIFSIKGGVAVSSEVTCTVGIQYGKNNGIRAVKEVDPRVTSLKLKGEFKAGVSLEPGAEFLGIDLVSIGADVGLGAEASLENVKISPVQWCIDAGAYIFLSLYAQVGPSSLNIRYDKEIWNSDHSPWHREYHFEESGMVDECTRGYGNYEGYVKRADNSVPIHNAKIQILKESRIVDTTYTDSHGKFVGTKLKSGKYKIRVSAAGYMPYERRFEIIGGDTTSIETQLMISDDDVDADNGEYRASCSGKIINAFTGGPVEGAKITVRSQFLFGDGDTIAVVESGSDGYYSFKAPIGSYEIAVSKNGFSSNSKDVTLIFNKSDVNISLNPDNQLPLSGNLRAVLHWGSTPRDLDSHMVGPQGDGRFHVYYRNMRETNVNLDVDNTSGYGPETISINETEPGVYSYYVHDYTNRGSSNSVAMSNSGAYVELYVGNVHLYTIHIPENREGTLWHVFDYNSETDQITLINEFSYESSPISVGMNVRTALFGLNKSEELKEYEKENSGISAEEIQEEEIQESSAAETSAKERLESSAEEASTKERLESSAEEISEEEIQESSAEEISEEEIQESSEAETSDSNKAENTSDMLSKDTAETEMITETE